MRERMHCFSITCIYVSFLSLYILEKHLFLKDSRPGIARLAAFSVLYNMGLISV